MFARAFREFIIWLEPCTNDMRMTKDLRVRCMRRPSVGYSGQLFAGRLVLML